MVMTLLPKPVAYCTEALRLLPTQARALNEYPALVRVGDHEMFVSASDEAVQLVLRLDSVHGLAARAMVIAISKRLKLVIVLLILRRF